MSVTSQGSLFSYSITFLCCVLDMKDMGWIRVVEVKVVVGFCEHGNEHEI